MKITNKRWDEAQEAERKCHDNFLNKAGVEGVREHYKNTYSTYFRYLGIDPNQEGKTIVEIGCADFPALELCTFERGILVEPLPSELLIEYVHKNDNVQLVTKKWEDFKITNPVDEIWLLNVMQHVQDPDLFLNKCKEVANVIRFFEPIDWPIEIYHPHTFDEEYYRGHFGDAVQRYMGTEKQFHTAHCAFGVWEKQ